MNTYTLKMTGAMTRDKLILVPASSLTYINVLKTKISGVMSAMGVLTCLILAVLSLNQPLRVELGTWLIPAQAYKILEASFSSVPSVAQEAAKIPASLIDGQAMDQQILKTSAERQAVARYVADKYKIAHSASLELVDKAIKVSREVDLDPTLILAVTAVESNFNPFAESNKGAQGLMQVMTRVHTDKYQLFGGHEAALDPDANMRVGSLILRQYIAKGGSLNAGLRLYVGASSVIINDGGYGKKVLAERERIRNAASTKFAYIPPVSKRL
jgi:soluble lytic murein transglycosylase-like protein